MSNIYRLMLITQRGQQSSEDYLQFIKLCAANGITSVQLREKNYSPEKLRQFALQLKKILLPYRIPLIINDHPMLAAEINAEGVHLGQSDAEISFARRILGEQKILGLSIESEHELFLANQNKQINYIAASAIFPSSNKSNIKKLWGIDGLKNLVCQSCHPVVAIGGISLQNAADIMNAGATGLAVIGAIHDAKNPALVCQQLRKIIDDYS